MAAQKFTVAAYQRHLEQRRLMASRCSDCGALYLPPRPICPACHTRNMTWAGISGDGTVAGFTSISIVPSSMAAKGFGRSKPYLTAVISLEDGPSIAARLELSGSADLDSVYVGMPVTAEFLAENEGEEKRVTLVFRPKQATDPRSA